MMAQASQFRRSGVAMQAGPYGQPFNAGAVALRHLKTPAEIASILHLRDEIDLSAHAGASPNFLALEKKETNWALLESSILKTRR